MRACVRVCAFRKVELTRMSVMEASHIFLPYKVIREISEENGGVIISFPKQGSDADRVTLKGAKDCIESTKARIKEIIEDLVRRAHLRCVLI